MRFYLPFFIVGHAGHGRLPDALSKTLAHLLTGRTENKMI
jgi:hypothetical protein